MVSNKANSQSEEIQRESTEIALLHTKNDNLIKAA